MSRFGTLTALGLGIGLGAAAHYLGADHLTEIMAVLDAWHGTAPAAERKVLYYRDPTGAPYWSATAKVDAAGHDFLPVYDDEEPSFDPLPPKAKPSISSLTGEHKVLYYRNPMGLPDTSPVPKKDSMGMDYIPVYADEQDDLGTVKVSLDKIQRIGVKTEKVEARSISQSVRGVGTVQHDESLLTVVTVRSDGYIEKLFANKVGQHVEKGEPLFRLYSPQIQLAQADLLVAVRARGRDAALGGDLDGAMQKLRNLDVPEARIEEVRKTMTNPRTLDWASPAMGDIIEKKVIEGQRVAAGDELFRIADHSRVWVIADVAESDISEIKVGTHAAVRLRAFPTELHEGTVTFIYPEMMRPETRTVSVRIELDNPDGQMRVGMYADVVFQTGADGGSVATVSNSAVIDSGARQVVLVSRGDGRFEPRAVKLGRRGEGYVEITEGLKPNEEVVTSANFLIDAESNLKAALQTFSQQGAPQ